MALHEALAIPIYATTLTAAYQAACLGVLLVVMAAAAATVSPRTAAALLACKISGLTRKLVAMRALSMARATEDPAREGARRAVWECANAHRWSRWSWRLLRLSSCGIPVIIS